MRGVRAREGDCRLDGACMPPRRHGSLRVRVRFVAHARYRHEARSQLRSAPIAAVPGRIAGVQTHPRTLSARLGNFDAALGALRDDEAVPRGKELQPVP